MLEHTTDYSTDVIKMTVWAYSASRATIIICKYKENEQNAYTRYLLLGKKLKHDNSFNKRQENWLTHWTGLVWQLLVPDSDDSVHDRGKA